jgi:hypothetical protein
MKEEIQAALGEINGLVKEGKLDEVPAFFVERQQEGMKQFVAAAKVQAEKFSAMAAAVEEKGHRGAQRVRSLTPRLSGSDLLELHIETIRRISDTEATGSLSPWPASLSPDARFVLFEESWYVEVPAMAGLVAMLTGLPTALTNLDGMIEGIRSGRLDPDALVKQLEQMAQMGDSAGAKGEGEAAAKEGKDAPESPDQEKDKQDDGGG